VFAPLGDGMPVFQWHSYRFEVPQGASHLAGTDSCESQAFRYGDNAYGFQFHLEMDAPLIERWLANPAYRAELEELSHSTDEATIRAQTRQHIGIMRLQANAVFNNFLDLIGRPQRLYTLPSREWL
jgi:GMP synthase (glutamine-hydrolysing)